MKIKNTKFDIVVNIICIVLLVGMVVYLFFNWTGIPDKVPMHHNFLGEVDRWGSKSEILILPAISWFLYILITITEHFPNIWNTGVEVTEQNKERVYRILKNMVVSTKLIIVCVLTYLVIQTSMKLELTAWFLPLFIVVLFGDMAFWMWKLKKAK